MHRVLFVLPGLEHGGAVGQACLLAGVLPQDRYRVKACILGRNGPLEESLREANVEVEILGWERSFDPRPLARLRELVRAFDPEVIHAWQLPALRALVLTARRKGSKLIAHGCLAARQRGGDAGWLDRWLLRRADCVIARGLAEAQRARHLGLPAHRIVRLPPGISTKQKAEGSSQYAAIGSTQNTANCQLPTANCRLLAGVGPLEPHKGYRDAIWALDILRHLHDDLHLLLIGTGSDRPGIEHFVRIAGVTDRVHFLGQQANVQESLALAELVWIPSWTDTGVHVALEAMAAGRPVVAARWPGLAEVIVDGETGFLVTPSDKGGLARRTHSVLEDAELRQRMGDAGRQRVEAHFAARTAGEHFTQLHETLLGIVPAARESAA